MGTSTPEKKKKKHPHAIGKFVENFDPTIEDSHRKEMKLKDGSEIKLDVIDTSGQVEFDMWHILARGAVNCTLQVVRSPVLFCVHFQRTYSMLEFLRQRIRTPTQNVPCSRILGFVWGSLLYYAFLFTISRM